MANGWLPRNGEEMVADIYQRLRFAARNPRYAKYLGEVPDAIDASAGHDTLPVDEYVDGLNDDYPLPTPPTPDAQPPDFEDSSPLDASGDFPAIGATKIHGDYWYAGGNTMNFTNYTFDQSGYGTSLTPGPAASVSPDDDKQIVLAESGLYQFRWRQSLQFTATGSQPGSVQVELHMSPFESIEGPFWTEVLVPNHYTVPAGRVAVGIDRSVGPIPLPSGAILTPKIGWVGTGDPTALTNFGMYLFVTKWS